MMSLLKTLGVIRVSYEWNDSAEPWHQISVWPNTGASNYRFDESSDLYEMVCLRGIQLIAQDSLIILSTKKTQWVTSWTFADRVSALELYDALDNIVLIERLTMTSRVD